MSFNKVFFHSGAPCNGCQGIGDLWAALDKDKMPFAAYSVDGGGLIAVDAAKYTNADHTLIYRTTATDVANYSLSPEDAAASTWSLLLSKLPPEIKAIKNRVWVEVGNEQDKNRADWLGHYYVALSKRALFDGYRIMGPGWSTGEPEPEAWETPGWKAYLTLCSQNPDRLAISCHEYSLDVNDILAQYPYLVGRFQFLLDACKKMNIAPPRIYITEAGWAHNDMPIGKTAENQIKQLAELYAKFPAVKAAFLWTLIGGGDKRELAVKLNSQIPFVTLYSLTANLPEPPQEPPPMPQPTDKYKGEVVLLPPDITQAQAIKIYSDRFQRKNTIAYSWDDARHALNNPRWLPTSTLTVFGLMRFPKETRQEILAYKPTVFAVPEVEQESGNPLDGLKLGHLFKYRYARTSPFNAFRDYGNKLHEGVDFDIVGGLANNTAAVLCAYDGVVTRSEDSTGGYGKFVVVKHQRNGGEFLTWYAHMDKRYVEVGRPVKMGDELGEVGTTGKVTGEHVHLNLQVPGRGLSGYVVADVVDPEPYMASGRNALPLINPEPPPAAVIDLLPYFLGDGTLYEVRHPNGSTETFQTQIAGNDFWLVKNAQFESLRYDQEYIWRGLDTSPGPAPNDAERPGASRYYIQFEPGMKMARWCKRFMSVGETWTGPGHKVQFYYKDTCQPSAKNSGDATNKITFVARHASKTWNGITIMDVVELKNNFGESFFYGRDWGLCAWKSTWGESAISEVLTGRPNLVREIIPCLSS